MLWKKYSVSQKGSTPSSINNFVNS